MDRRHSTGTRSISYAIALVHAISFICYKSIVFYRECAAILRLLRNDILSGYYKVARKISNYC